MQRTRMSNVFSRRSFSVASCEKIESYWAIGHMITDKILQTNCACVKSKLAFLRH